MSSGQVHSSNYLAKTSNCAFSHPDYTVGFGVSPNHALTALAGFTAGRDLGVHPHPAPKADLFVNSHYTRCNMSINGGYNVYLQTPVTSSLPVLYLLLLDVELLHHTC
jgi:hypothetical protein